jgi:hypothetical protein
VTTQLPNRDARVTVVHPTTFAAPGDPPLNPLTQLAGWNVHKVPSGSNVYVKVNATPIPTTQTTFDVLDLPPGTWNFKSEWVDPYGQVSEPSMSSCSVPFPAKPSNGSSSAALI